MGTGLNAIEREATGRALRRASTWFGVGLVVEPVLRIADDAGLVTAPNAVGERRGLVALGTIALFVAIGIAASMLLARHRARDRTWFFVACVAVLVVHLVHAGLRASGILALVALALAFVQMRLAGATDSPSVDRAPP